jgi:hypothetical protein
VILLCVRWYFAHGLSLRDLKEIDGGTRHRRGPFDHPPLGRLLLASAAGAFQSTQARRDRKMVCRRDYIKVRGRWMYLYRAIESAGDTVELHGHSLGGYSVLWRAIGGIWRASPGTDDNYVYAIAL